MQYHYNTSLEHEEHVETACEPEAILVEHLKAITSLAWHPKMRGYLLTASEDGYVKLWERRLNEEQDRERPQNSMLRWIEERNKNQKQSYSWRCKEEFKTKHNTDHILEVKWSPWL